MKVKGIFMNFERKSTPVGVLFKANSSIRVCYTTRGLLTPFFPFHLQDKISDNSPQKSSSFPLSNKALPI